MTDFLQLFFSGLATGSIYALAALGFTLLWQASGTINFAQGEFVMLPAFIMLAFASFGAPLPLAFALTCMVAVVILDVSIDDKGDIDRESFMVEVKDGKQLVKEVLPALGKK